MNLNLDFSVVTRLLRGVLGDLREKRLWPVAVVLLAALVAVPLLLSKSSTPAPAPQAALPTPPPSGASIPALNVQSTPAHTRITGAAHNPFATHAATASSPTGAATAASTAASSVASNVASALGTGGANTGSSLSTGGSLSTSTTSPVAAGSSGSTGANPPSITPNAKPKPAPSGLTPTQAYDVSLAITTSSGGINTVDPLVRMSAIPSDQQPLLIEMGVLQGGNRVLFAVQPGAVVTGPGACIPGPLDCEVLSLGQDQTEQLSARTGSVGVSQVALFAVTGISATSYSSVAAADKARRDHSQTGQALLDKSPLSALSLFEYEPSLGSIVDLRNLKVGS